MHEVQPDGTVIASYCDFCRAKFEDQAMIEGHQGSLMCLSCLTVAYADVSLAGGGHENVGKKCTMCLEERRQPQWQSPAQAVALPINAELGRAEHHEFRWVRPAEAERLLPERLQPVLAWARTLVEPKER